MIMMGMRLIKTKLNNMNEPTNSEALPSHELLAILNSRQRVKFEFGRYYPQWRLPIIPLWFNYMGAYECSVSFTTLKDAVGYFKPSEKPIIYSANAKAHTPATNEL